MIQATLSINNGSREDFSGSSAATAIASGVIALTLKANSHLTWRDVQHIIVQTSNPNGLQAMDWNKTPSGRKYSRFFWIWFYGCTGDDQSCKNWNTFPPIYVCQPNPLQISIGKGTVYMFYVQICHYSQFMYLVA